MQEFIKKINPKAGITQFTGTGSPEGVVIGYVGQWYLDADTDATYRKDSGDNTNSGWALKGSGGFTPISKAYASVANTALITSATTLAPFSGTNITTNVRQFTVGTSSLTCNKAGTYVIRFSVDVEPNATASVPVSLLVNSTTVAQARYDSTATGAGFFQHTSGGVIVSLSNGDVIRVSKSVSTDPWKGISVDVVEIP